MEELNIHIRNRDLKKLWACVKNIDCAELAAEEEYMIFKIICEEGDMVIAQEFVDRGFNVPDANRSFHDACGDGHLDVLKWMYAHPKFRPEITMDGNDGWGLCFACENGYIDTVKWLMETFIDIDVNAHGTRSAFNSACTNGHMDIMKMLYAHQSTIDEHDVIFAIYSACRGNKIRCARWLYDTQGFTMRDLEISEIMGAVAGEYSEYYGTCAIEWVFGAVCELQVLTPNDIDPENPLGLFSVVGCDFDSNICSIKWLYDKSADFRTYFNNLPKPQTIERLCLMGKYHIAKWVHSTTCTDADDRSIRWEKLVEDACMRGPLSAVEWLHAKLIARTNSTQTHTDFMNEVFWSACIFNSDVCISQWVAHTIDIQVLAKNITPIIYSVFDSGNAKTAEWLMAKYNVPNKIEIYRHLVRTGCDSPRTPYLKHVISKCESVPDADVFYVNLLCDACTYKNTSNGLVLWIYINYIKPIAVRMGAMRETYARVVFRNACLSDKFSMCGILFRDFTVEELCPPASTINALFQTICSYDDASSFAIFFYEKFKFEKTMDVFSNNNAAMRNACVADNIQIAKKIIGVWEQRGGNATDIITDGCVDENGVRGRNAFWGACLHNRVNVARWLYSLNPCEDMITTNDDDIFTSLRDQYMNGPDYENEDILLWLVSVCPSRYSVVRDLDGNAHEWIIIKPLRILQTPVIMFNEPPEVCPICFENKCDLVSECSHKICKQCVVKIHTHHMTVRCPMCRTPDVSFSHIVYELD